MSHSERAVVVTHFPSPYQVELFNEVERQRPGLLSVFYLFRRVSSRSWSGVPMTHVHGFLDDRAGLAAAGAALEVADGVIFNYYNDSRAARLIRARAATGRPWAFWGERPGYRFPWLAHLVRLGRLASLRSGDQPIWGIGQWAIDAYRSEFGRTRAYLNLPYYSNLARFEALRPTYSPETVTFLFSGSLSHRKGVDLLAAAFFRLSAQNPRVRLIIMGEGHFEPHLRSLLGSNDRVEWVGFKDWDHLPVVYQRAHILCVPSRHDGWGLVVPEGLASGLPTIATTRTGAALDLVEPNSNGWLIPAGEVDALYGAMKQAATLSETDWLAMSRGARSSVANRSLANGAARMIEGITSLIASPGAHA